MNPTVIAKLDTFFTQYQKQQYGKGDILIPAAEAPKGIFYLTQGHVRQYSITKDGEELTLNVFKPYAFFPASWALGIYKPAYYFEAMDNVLVYLAPKETVLTFLKTEPDVLLDLVERLYRGLDGIFLRMEQLMSGNAVQRLVTILVIMAKRFGTPAKNAVTVTLKLTHQDLGALAGLTRETVSREMIHLREKGVIDYSNTIITINNMSSLMQELSA